MGCERNTCETKDIIIDNITGYLVCTKCGSVKEAIFVEEYTYNYFSPITTSDPLKNEVNENIKDVLDRIHIPTTYSTDICKYYFKFYKGMKLRALLFSCYKVLNEYGFKVSLKDLLNVNGFNNQSIFSTQCVNENVLIDTLELVNKYYSFLNLNFKDISLIKEMITKRKISGHTPLTIVAGNIYLYCKSKKRKILLKKYHK